MLTGAVFIVSWQLRSTSDGPEFNGKIATLAGGNLLIDGDACVSQESCSAAVSGYVISHHETL